MEEHVLNEISSFLEDIYDEWKDEEVMPEKIWHKFNQLDLIGLAQKERGGMKEFSVLVKKLLKFKRIGLVGAYAINEIVVNLINKFNSEIDESVLNSINTGKKKLALCITEEHAGSDMSAISTSAEEDGDDFILNGKKVLVSNGPLANYYVVAAKTNTKCPAWAGISIFLVSRELCGVNVSQPIKKAGVNLMPIGELTFDNVRIPGKCLLGRKNRGFHYLVNALQFERTIISVVSTCMCEMIYDEIISYINERVVFDKKLRDYQSIKFQAASFYSRLKVLRSYISDVMSEVDEGRFDKMQIIVAKIMATDLLKELSIYYIQVLGGRGYLASHWAYNLYNEVRWTGLAGGSNELLLDVLGGNIINMKQI